MREYIFETVKENTHQLIVKANSEITDVLEQYNPNKGDLPKLTLFAYYAANTQLQFDDFAIDKFLFMEPTNDH